MKPGQCRLDGSTVSGVEGGDQVAALDIEQTRPLYRRVAEENAASAKALARAGFVEVGSETAFAPGVDAEIVERIYRLDRESVALQEVDPTGDSTH